MTGSVTSSASPEMRMGAEAGVEADARAHGATAGGICITPAALSQVMPMFLWLGADGTIQDAGPTLTRIVGTDGLVGRDFFTLFQIKRPRVVDDMDSLLNLAGGRLHLQMRDGAQTAFRGLAVALAQGRGALVNLSFGISVADAVRDHDLNNADFAPTDLTVELLYLVEAKTLVMEELHDLARRLQQAKSTAEAEALTDTLTGLVNRRGFDQVIADLVRERQFGLMHLDLDFFKSVNDTLGHAAGDHVLRQVARRLHAETRGGDTVARIGGDEFVLLFPGLSDPEVLVGIGRRIIARLSERIDYFGRPCRISASIGLTVSSFYDPPDPARMLSDADHALYASKNHGRARITVWGPGKGEDAITS